MNASPEPSINLRSLDSLRGLLSVYVLAGHARWLLWVGWEAWRGQPHGMLDNALARASAGLRYGHEAVMVFFVLSGFFIHFRMARTLATGDQRGAFDWSDFLRRRARRLVPPYLFALLLTVCMDTAGHHFFAPLYRGETGDALLDNTVGRGGFAVASILPALCLLPGSLGHPFGSNGPLWSLAYEIVYYLLYPFWLRLRLRAGAGAAYGAAGALCALSVAFPAMQSHFWGGVLAHYPIWLAGAGLVETFTRRTWPGWSIPAAAILAAGGLACSQIRNEPVGVVLLFYALAGTAAVFLFARLPARCSAWRLGRLTELLGFGSYTIYICHFPLLAFGCALVFHGAGQRPASGGLALSGGLVAVLACSLFFCFCERPFLDRKRRRVLQVPAPTVV